MTWMEELDKVKEGILNLFGRGRGANANGVALDIHHSR